MGTTILWALLTGTVTGAAWMGIVLLRRQARLLRDYRSLRLEMERRLDALEATDTQLAQLEERLDFTERILRSEPPPAEPRDGGS